MKEQLKNKLSELSIKDWIITVLAIIIILLSLGCAIAVHKYHDAKGDVVIWNDSTLVYKNKYNEEYLAKNTYILEVQKLKEYNEELYKEYQSLKDHPIVITKTDIITKIDTIKTNIDSLFSGDNIIDWDWSANDKDFYHISGGSYVEFGNDSTSVGTEIDNITINSRLTLDVIDNGKQLEVIAKTDNPYVTLSDMQSVVIDPTTSPTLSRYYKPKRWGFGPYLGVGINGGTDFKGSPQIGWGVSIGFAIHYDIFQW